jgi:hypothetical protein
VGFSTDSAGERGVNLVLGLKTSTMGGPNDTSKEPRVPVEHLLRNAKGDPDALADRHGHVR